MSRITLAIALLALVLIAPQVGAASSVYSYGGPPVAIPDGITDPGHAWASIVVTDDFSITDLDVEINTLSQHLVVGIAHGGIYPPHSAGLNSLPTAADLLNSLGLLIAATVVDDHLHLAAALEHGARPSVNHGKSCTRQV